MLLARTPDADGLHRTHTCQLLRVRASKRFSTHPGISGTRAEMKNAVFGARRRDVSEPKER
jgi:hypothetical protein